MNNPQEGLQSSNPQTPNPNPIIQTRHSPTPHSLLYHLKILISREFYLYFGKIIWITPFFELPRSRGFQKIWEEGRTYWKLLAIPLASIRDTKNFNTEDLSSSQDPNEVWERGVIEESEAFQIKFPAAWFHLSVILYSHSNFSRWRWKILEFGPRGYSCKNQKNSRNSRNHLIWSNKRLWD